MSDPRLDHFDIIGFLPRPHQAAPASLQERLVAFRLRKAVESSLQEPATSASALARVLELGRRALKERVLLRRDKSLTGQTKEQRWDKYEGYRVQLLENRARLEDAEGTLQSYFDAANSERYHDGFNLEVAIHILGDPAVAARDEWPEHALLTAEDVVEMLSRSLDDHEHLRHARQIRAAWFEANPHAPDTMTDPIYDLGEMVEMTWSGYETTQKVNAKLRQWYEAGLGLRPDPEPLDFDPGPLGFGRK